MRKRDLRKARKAKAQRRHEWAQEQAGQGFPNLPKPGAETPSGFIWITGCQAPRVCP